jgi:hypothetical protein
MLITIASGLNDTQYGKIQAPVKQYITEQDEAWKQKSMLDLLFSTETSDNFGETYGGETALGDFVPGGENASYPENSFQDGYQKLIQDIEWRDRFSVSAKMVEDVKMGKIKQGGNRFMGAYYRTREKYGADIYTKGQDTTMTFNGHTFDISGADGLALFSTAHTSKTGGYANQSNLYDGSYSYDNLSKLEAYGHNIRDDEGNRLGVSYDTILVPNGQSAATVAADAAQTQAIFEDLNGDGKPDSADRAGNYHFGRWNVVVWPYLGIPTTITTSNSYFILIDSTYLKDYSAMVWQTRKDLAVKSYVDENTDANIWKGRARFAACHWDWRFAAAVIPGSGGTSLS